MTSRKPASALLALALFSALGCEEKGGGAGVKEGGSLARAPKQELPAADPKYVPRPSPQIVGSTEKLNDAVASLTSTNPGDQTRVFDGNSRTGDVNGGGDAVLAANSTYKPVAYTGKGRGNTLRTGDVPEPKADTLRVPELSAGTQSGRTRNSPVLAAYEAFQKRLYDAMYPVYNRLSWNARPSKNGEVKHDAHRVTVHHTQGRRTTSEADTLAAVRDTQHYHQTGRAAQGKDTWDDIGYHFLIDGEGRVVEGRRADALGAHVGGANTGNIGIAMMGDYNVLEPTAAQKDSLKRLITFLALKYKIDPRQPGFLEGHKHFNSTDCPGKNLAAFLPSLRQAVVAETSADLVKLGAGFTPLVATLPSNPAS